MTCEIAFLPVGNADSIVIRPAGGSAVVIDLHKIPILLKWFQNKKETNISRIYITHEHLDHFPSLEDLVTFLENWLKRGTVGTLCLPYEVYKEAKKKVASSRGANKRLEDALLRLKRLRYAKNPTTLSMRTIIRHRRSVIWQSFPLVPSPYPLKTCTLSQFPLGLFMFPALSSGLPLFG